MATTIGNTSSDQYASMVNSTWARPVTIPANWSALRIGIRYRVTDLGTGPSGTPRFAMGLCSGTTNILGDATTTHFVGVISNSATWGYYGGASSNVYYSIAAPPYKKVNTTETFGTAITGDSRFTIYSANTNNRYVHFIEITKGSPNYTLNIFSPIGNSPVYDCTQNGFLSLMQSAAGGLVVSAFSYGTPQTIAVNEGVDGTLNAVNLWWNRADFNFEIHDVGLAVLS